ncbi:MAG TPA: DUF222 domain-containing protein [Acidimicrobiales bacterium]|nr:DUF222 domain-containing protein [Acidimicrobiales bacterium]
MTTTRAADRARVEPSARPTADLVRDVERLGAQVSAVLGEMLPILGELGRREAFRDDGATSLAAWTSGLLGVSEKTGRRWARLGESLWDFPKLTDGLRQGEVTLDKVEVAVALATPETEGEILEQSKACSVRQLAALATRRARPRERDPQSPPEGRYLRFNDDLRTISAKLLPADYAMVRETIVRQAKSLPHDGITPWDQRLADGLVRCLSGRASAASSDDYLVVVHTDLSYLQGDDGMAEIERLGLIDRETLRRICCEADIVLALDDDDGHTMMEGRRHRFPTPTQRREVWRRDRHCRFPGCSNTLFTQVHHIVHWTPDGRTDLPNLVLLCDHHHDRVHTKGWAVSGDANDTLTFLTPTGRRMTTRPSPLWSRDGPPPEPSG